MRKKRAVAVLILVLVVLVPTLAFFVAPLTLQAYDSAHPESIRCDVHSASVEGSSSRSLKGVGGSGTQVVIESVDCGTLLLRSGINADNAENAVRQLSRGGTYSFEVGAGSYAARSFLHVLGVSSTVADFKSSS